MSRVVADPAVPNNVAASGAFRAGREGNESGGAALRLVEGPVGLAVGVTSY